MIRTSIRLRLLLWIGAWVGLMLVALGYTAFEFYRRTGLAQMDDELARRVSALTQDIRPGPGRARPAERDGTRTPPPRPPDWGQSPAPGERPAAVPPGERKPGEPPGGRAPERRTIKVSSDTAALFDESDEDGPFFLVWSRTGRLLNRSANAPGEWTAPTAPAGHTGILFTDRDGHRVAIYWTEMGDCALVGMSFVRHEAATRQFLGWLLVAGVFVAGVGAGGGWLLISRALRPVAEIGATAQRIAAGNLSERILTTDPDTELGRLAGVLNQTFAQLEAAFAEQRQFTADASHEVRTPLTVIISEAQASLARPRTEAEYRETLEVCLEAAQDMRRLADSLLELARLDADRNSVVRAELDLAELAEAAVQRIRPLAEGRGIEIRTALAPAPLRADAGRLRQVLFNLIENALSYNYDRGTVEVRTRREGAQVVLEVADTGRGIAPEHLPHIFQRFYRAASARTSTDRHAGLGLAIVHAIVQSHGGTIEVDSKLGLGSTFTVRLPA